MKRLKVIAILLAFAIIFTGCSMVEVNEERDRETVVAKVGDEVVLKGEVLDQLEYMVNMYSMYYGYTLNEEETEDEIKAIVDSLVDSKLEIVMAEEKGCYDFTAEQQEELQLGIDEAFNTYAGQYATELAEQEEFAEMELEELEVYALEHLNEFFEANNFGVTKEDIIDDFNTSKAREVLYQQATSSAVVTEDEVKAMYDSYVAERQTAYEDGTALFESDANGDTQLYYVPEGARQAQHILISLSDEAKEEIAALRAEEGDDIADLKRLELLKEIDEAAWGAYQRAIDGEDFVALMVELGEDPGMETTEYYVSLNPSYYFVEEFTEGLFALDNVGDISEPVGSDFGYHIIKYYGDMQSGPVSYDDLHDDIYESMQDERESAAYTEQMDIWRESADIKIYYNRALN